jgi:hypothetical protein
MDWILKVLDTGALRGHHCSSYVVREEAQG